MISGIKICGVSDLKTLKYITEHPCPPQFIGFITNYKKSKRYVDFENLKELLNVRKNGINFDRSNASSALIRNNTIYFNGAHDLVQDISVSVEGNPSHGGQKVAGIKANYVKKVTVVNNIVETRFDNYSALELLNLEENELAGALGDERRRDAIVRGAVEYLGRVAGSAKAL